MKKKIFILSIFLFMLCLIPTFKKVYADNNVSIKNLTLEQNNKALKKNNEGAYLTTGYEHIRLAFNLANYTEGENYYFVFEYPDSSKNSLPYSSGYMTLSFIPSYVAETEEYILKICDNAECNTTYVSEAIKIKPYNYENIKDGEIKVNKIMQAGNEIIPDENNNVHFNNQQDIDFYIKGENLADDELYRLYLGIYGAEEYYLGSELEAGIVYTQYPRLTHDISFRYYVGNIYLGNIEYDFNGTTYVWPQYTDDDSIGSYETSLFYTNYQNETINKYRTHYNYNYNYNKYFYLIEKDYHNSNNTLSYQIDGEDFQDRDYLVSINIKLNRDSIYTKSESVNGLLLNDKYNIELTNLTLNSDAEYEFYVTIDNVSDKKTIFYSMHNLVVNKVSQDDKKLSFENGLYMANNIGYVYYSLNLEKGYDSSKDYYYWTQTDNSSGWGSKYDKEYDISSSFLPTFEDEIITQYIFVYSDKEYKHLYGFRALNIKLTKYNEIKNSKVYITKVTQGGEEILPDENNVFHFNNRQDIFFDIKGSNLLSDYDYMIKDGTWENNSLKTKNELENGFTFHYYTKNISSMNLQYSFKYEYSEYITKKIAYYNGENYLDFSYVVSGSYDTGNYTAKIVYKNYEDNAIEVRKDNYDEPDYYIIKSQYHNSNNNLSYVIDGANYQDKDYTVDIKVLIDNQEVYHKNVSVNGLLLNNKYHLELDDLILQTKTTYTFIITIDGVGDKFNAKYIDRTITITKVLHDGVEINKENDYYLIPGFGSIVVYYEIDNYDRSKDGLLYSPDSGYYRQKDNYLNLNYYNDLGETFEKSIDICDNYDCNIMYAHQNIKFKFARYNDIKDSKVYITDIKQNGLSITPDANGHININNKENVTYTIKGVNLLDDEYYYIWMGNNATRYLGSELTAGVERTTYTNVKNFSEFYYDFKGYNSSNIYYYDGINYQNVDFDTTYLNYDDGFDANLIYTQNKNIPIEKSDVEYREYYIVDGKYHNNNKSLSVNIVGNDLEDRNYPVEVEVRIGTSGSSYKISREVNGLLLNAGYELELTGLVLELTKNVDLTNMDYHLDYLYYFYVSVGGIAKQIPVRYNSVGNDTYIKSEIFFENGKKNLNVYRGMGSVLSMSGFYDTNRDVFNKYSGIYINYLGSGFKELEQYDYILEYCEHINLSMGIAKTCSSLKEGQVSGLVLNHIGLFFKVDNKNDYVEPIYSLTIKKGDEVLYIAAPIISLYDAATLGNASLSAKNHNLYLRTDDYSYIATRNAPIDIVLSGMGFDDDKTYTFDIYSSLYDANDERQYSKVELNGSDLNRGTATFRFNEPIGKDIDEVSMEIACHDLEKNAAARGYLTITFVDSKDLLPTITNYILDDAKDLIKKIKKQTTVDDFVNNIEVANNGKVKVFDKTGTQEITDKVGTGMITRIMTEYDQNVLDIDTVVTGDTNGDGNISISDVIKVERHIVQLSELEGVYEMAADVNGNGNVNVNDLIKITRDIAGVEEIK